MSQTPLFIYSDQIKKTKFRGPDIAPWSNRLFSNLDLYIFIEKYEISKIKGQH